MSYDDIKSYKKPRFQPFFRRYNFRKAAGGEIKLTLPPPSAVLGLRPFRTILPNNLFLHYREIFLLRSLYELFSTNLDYAFTGLDKFNSSRRILWARNFICAPDRARKKLMRKIKKCVRSTNNWKRCFLFFIT